MIALAYSSTSRSELCLAERGKLIAEAKIGGINPHFHSRIDVSRILRLQTPKEFMGKKLERSYFYAPGCTSATLSASIKSPLETLLKAPAVVNHNIVGAARALFQDEPGIACILDSEACSGFYNGMDIEKYTRSAGYILGGEGSSVGLGKIFLADFLQGLAADDIKREFFEQNHTYPEDFLNSIYMGKNPYRLLSVISYFLYEHIEHPYIHDLVAASMRRFLERNILRYDKYDSYPIRIIGTTAKMYSGILRESAQKMGIYIDAITESPIKGLIRYHMTHRGITEPTPLPLADL